ncbi:type IV secretory system conjugative DNA transfer family protein [Hyphomicrobium sp. MC8b]|uniref:type IV secretory system conjugative DNA transfer family protein n=1 Tax=Hyphomicrobium sp. MC8b TaxID=300273 RepID=UPI00391A3CAC
MGVLDDLPRGVSSREIDQHQMPSSAFADPAQVVKAAAYRFDGGKILLGVLDGKVHDSGKEHYVTGGSAVGIGDDRHAVVCAGSRAGKGRSCIVPTLLEWGGSVLALDPKGELADITARRRGEMGQRVCIVDPFGITAKRLEKLRAGFNPLTLLKTDSATLIEDAGLIADAFVPGEGRDPHWDDSARTLIEGLLLHIATWPGYEKRRNLATLRDLLMRGVVHEYGGKRLEGMEGLHMELSANGDILAGSRPDLAEAVDGAANDFFDRPVNERGSVLSTARRHTKFLDYPPIRASLSSHGFELTDLKTAPKGLTIYLCLPAGRMATCARWFRLFVNLALEAMEREPSKPKIPVLAVLEEFHVLGTMRQLEVAAGLVAGFGMKLLVVLQDLTQLKRHYKEGWETFLGNAGILVFFGNSDLTTLEFISKRCGQTSLIVERKSEATVKAMVESGNLGRSWSLEVREVLTAEEASRFFGRDDRQQRALVIRSGGRPMVVQRVKYDRHEMFAGKWDKR